MAVSECAPRAIAMMRSIGEMTDVLSDEVSTPLAMSEPAKKDCVEGPKVRPPSVRILRTFAVDESDSHSDGSSLDMTLRRERRRRKHP